MAPTTIPTSGKIDFPSMMGTKRRRMRSGGNVSTATNNVPVNNKKGAMDDEKVAETSRCKGATTIPIFLKKTYKMIDTCDSTIASWTPDGEMFVVKDPDAFATQVIPQYFDHNKFSSFARQLNFYGFRKMQSKPIRNADYDVDTAKHVTFYNEKFKRGRCDLLKEIQRSTRGGGGTSQQDHAKEIMQLKKQVADLEHKLEETNNATEERMRRLELDMLSRMEQMMLAMQQHQQTQLSSLQSQTSTAGSESGVVRQSTVASGWDPLPLDDRQKSTNSVTFSVLTRDTSTKGGPTLPPHPKQKQFPPAAAVVTNDVNALKLPPSRLNSLRGISRGMSRGVSEASSASAVLMRNSWEDKFFSMLMLGENEAAAAAAAAQAAAANGPEPSPIADATPITDATMEAAIISEEAQKLQRQDSDHTFSSVSETEAI